MGGRAMSTSDAQKHAARVEMRYVSGIPKQMPTGRVVVHNQVRPQGFPNIKLGFNGFRAWTQLLDERLVVCDCGWAPQLEEHYRVE